MIWVYSNQRRTSMYLIDFSGCCYFFWLSLCVGVRKCLSLRTWQCAVTISKVHETEKFIYLFICPFHECAMCVCISDISLSGIKRWKHVPSIFFPFLISFGCFTSFVNCHLLTWCFRWNIHLSFAGNFVAFKFIFMFLLPTQWDTHIPLIHFKGRLIMVYKAINQT